MEVDPIVLAVFGPPPEGMDLTEDQSVANTVASVVCLFLAIVAMGLRLWARSIQNFGIKADDWLIIVALVGLVVAPSQNFSLQKDRFSCVPPLDSLSRAVMPAAHGICGQTASLKSVTRSRYAFGWVGCHVFLD